MIFQRNHGKINDVIKKSLKTIGKATFTERRTQLCSFAATKYSPDSIAETSIPQGVSENEKVMSLELGITPSPFRLPRPGSGRLGQGPASIIKLLIQKPRILTSSGGRHGQVKEGDY